MDNIFNVEIESLPLAKIRELQLKSLKKTVYNVYENVPFYQKKFKELKLKPGDIKTLGDTKEIYDAVETLMPILKDGKMVKYDWK